MKSKKLLLEQLAPIILISVFLLAVISCIYRPGRNDKKHSAGQLTSLTESKTDETASEESTTDETTSEESSAEETTLEETTSEESETIQETKKTESRTEEAKSEPTQTQKQTESPQSPFIPFDNGIFSAYYEAAYSRMLQMTIDEKIGQMLFARCPSNNAAGIASQYHIGGYVLFGRDFQQKTAGTVKSDILSYKAAQQIPIAIATDEEGGSVVRVSSNPNLSDEKFDSPRNIYNLGGMELIKSKESKKAALLSGLYIDTNFAPVCDISVNESDFMYNRSLGQDAGTTADFVRTVTNISQSKGVSVTLKHFPGYGNNVDTHTGIAIDNRDYNTFVTNDFIPFRAGIESGAHLVMVSHNIVNCMDSTKPASISKNVHDILRGELGFTGIIVTDDLSMDAIKQYSGEYPPTVMAVLAGNDMLTVSDIGTSFNEIKNAVNRGIIDQSIIDRAVIRILAWKYAKGLM
ncbi:MAG: beta-hexosaminidase [Lachnospiraceae bacterium]|nr:beta-hexosaminidase [Lachnospiraceae bacterium]